MSSSDRMTLKVVIGLIAVLVLGMTIELWLMIAPPVDEPPHPSYLPAD